MFTFAIGTGGETLREFVLTREIGAQLRGLKEAVYGKPVDPRVFDWHYFGHPRSKDFHVFGVEEDGKLIAATTRMPATFRAGGADCPAFFNIDSMVHPAHRRRGCMRDLYKLARSALGGSPLFFSKGSSSQIYPLLVSVGHRPITPNTSLVSYPSTARWLMSRLHIVGPGERQDARPLPGFPDFRPVDRFGADFDACFERASRGLAGVFVRDAALMNWRYVDIPHRRYLRYARVQDGVTIGVVIVWAEGGQAGIVDLLWDPSRPEEPARSVRFAQALCDRHRAFRVGCFATHPRLRAALLSEGFVDRGETPRFSAFVPEDREAMFEGACAALHVVDGDGDTEFS